MGGGRNKKLIIESTLECKANCIYCYNSKNKNNQSVDVKLFQISDEYLKKWKINNVIITGGEPLQDFERTVEIIRYYKDKVNYIEMITNGLLLSDRKLNKLIESGLDGISISCDGVHNKTQFALRKITPEKIWNIISKVKQKGNKKIRLNLLYALTTLNSSKKNLEEFIKEANKANVDGIKFQPVTADLNESIIDLVISSPEILPIIELIERNKQKWSVINSTYFFDFSKQLFESDKTNKEIICPIPESNLFINAEGILLKCPILNPNVREARFNSITQVEFKKFKCKLKTHCLCMF